MRILARPNIDTTPLEALRASMRAWLVETLAWLIETLAPLKPHAPAWARAAIAAAERQLDKELREAARDLRMLLLAHAYARLPALYTPAFTRGARPFSVRRRAQANSFLRKATATALKNLHTGSLRQRAERLRDLLDNIEPLIAATGAQLMRMFTRPRLPGALAMIVQDTLASALKAAPLAADSS